MSFERDIVNRAMEKLAEEQSVLDRIGGALNNAVTLGGHGPAMLEKLIDFTPEANASIRENASHLMDTYAGNDRMGDSKYWGSIGRNLLGDDVQSAFEAHPLTSAYNTAKDDLGALLDSAKNKAFGIDAEGLADNELRLRQHEGTALRNSGAVVRDALSSMLGSASDSASSTLSDYGRSTGRSADRAAAALGKLLSGMNGDVKARAQALLGRLGAGAGAGIDRAGAAGADLVSGLRSSAVDTAGKGGDALISALGSLMSGIQGGAGSVGAGLSSGLAEGRARASRAANSAADSLVDSTRGAFEGGASAAAAAEKLLNAANSFRIDRTRSHRNAISEAEMALAKSLAEARAARGEGAFGDIPLSSIPGQAAKLTGRAGKAMGETVDDLGRAAVIAKDIAKDQGTKGWNRWSEGVLQGGQEIGDAMNNLKHKLDTSSAGDIFDALFRSGQGFGPSSGGESRVHSK